MGKLDYRYMLLIMNVLEWSMCMYIRFALSISNTSAIIWYRDWLSDTEIDYLI